MTATIRMWWTRANRVKASRLGMICSAPGTYSAPSRSMKSCCVSSSQNMIGVGMDRPDGLMMAVGAGQCNARSATHPGTAWLRDAALTVCVTHRYVARREMVRTVEWRNGAVVLLDQRLLPTQEVYRVFRDYRGVAGAIKDMIVRGAPAIGVTAALGIALWMSHVRRDPK